MHTKAELLELLRAHGIRLSKRLGQHYLIDPRLTVRLIDACRLTTRDTVIEIGAGLGALTEGLAARAGQVVAVEVDRAVAALLARRMAPYPNVQAVCQDILSFAWERHPDSLVVGAIPYAITSPILVMLGERPVRIRTAWLGIQKEVATRLMAKPGTKAYGRLTVLVQYRFTVARVIAMPRQAFFPVPAVDSVWIRLTPKPAHVFGVRDERLFFEVVRAAFSQRRKTLLNGLGRLTAVRLTRPEALELIRAVGLPERVRGETLSLEQFAALANTLTQRRGSIDLSGWV